jgi:hypothetical protein
MKVGLAPNTSALTLFSGLGRTYQASTVLPFYSHTRRDDVEKTVDDSLGIDRRCFSNLFPCPIALPARLKEVNGTTDSPLVFLFTSPIEFAFNPL